MNSRVCVLHNCVELHPHSSCVTLHIADSQNINSQSDSARPVRTSMNLHAHYAAPLDIACNTWHDRHTDDDLAALLLQNDDLTPASVLIYTCGFTRSMNSSLSVAALKSSANIGRALTVSPMMPRMTSRASGPHWDGWPVGNAGRPSPTTPEHSSANWCTFCSTPGSVYLGLGTACRRHSASKEYVHLQRPVFCTAALHILRGQVPSLVFESNADGC